MNPVKIFIAYSRLDGKYLEALQKHLKPLDRNRTIKIWYDGEIVAGSDWEQNIKDHLEAADIILLLVSANSLASDYFYDKEMADALARHKTGTATVIPIILSHCAWQITELSELQALPKDGKPLSDWADASKAYTDIVMGISECVKAVKEKQKAAAIQQKQEAEAERQRKIAAAEEQKRLENLKRQAVESEQRKKLEAERRQKELEEQERLRQLELQKEREKIAEQKAQAEQKRLTSFKQHLLEADKATLHENWATAITAYQKSLGYYSAGDNPTKANILEKLKAAQQKRREQQITTFKSNTGVRYGALGLLLLLCLFGLSQINWTGNSDTTKTADDDSLSSESQTPFQSSNSPFEGGKGDVVDSTAEYTRLLQIATDFKNQKAYEQAIAYADSTLLYQPEDKKALALKKEAEAAQAIQPPEEKVKVEDEAYTKLIQKADRNFKAQKWADAKSDYTAALALKPKENYPNHQLEKIETQLNKIAQAAADERAKEQKNSQYNQLLADASKAYDKGQYTTAKSKYQEAIRLNPSEKSYLQGKIAAIDKILNPPPKPKPEPQKTTTTSNLHPEVQKLLNDMVYVQGGTFKMGSEDGSDDEKPIHSVTLSSYQIGKYEVTQAQWEAVMGNNPSRISKGCGNCPVETVSWNDAQDFIKKLNQLTGKTFRLPTEAEWEFAARGGTKSRNYKYAGSNSIDEVAWYTSTTNDFGTKAVGTKKANELGLYDMSGNVWEWCNDWYGSDYYAKSPEKNPRGASSATSRVLRGGSWYSFNNFCRVALRNFYSPSIRYGNFGFRLAQ